MLLHQDHRRDAQFNSPIHKTLVAAVKAAGLVDTLNSVGPFTVFAPTDAAFGKLPAGTVDTLVKPENCAFHLFVQSSPPPRSSLSRISSKDIADGIKAGNGKYEMVTVEGGKLTATMKNWQNRAHR